MKKLLFLIPLLLSAYGSYSVPTTYSNYREIYGKGITDDGLPKKIDVVENDGKACKENWDCADGYECDRDYGICIEEIKK